MDEITCPPGRRCVLVCQYRTCQGRGSDRLLVLLRSADLPEDVDVLPAPCQGQCSVGPTVRILPEETWYCRMKIADGDRLVREHLHGGQVLQDKLNPRIHWVYQR